MSDFFDELDAIQECQELYENDPTLTEEELKEIEDLRENYINEDTPESYKNIIKLLSDAAWNKHAFEAKIILKTLFFTNPDNQLYGFYDT